LFKEVSLEAKGKIKIIKTEIRGLKHRNVSSILLPKLLKEQLQLLKEPDNKFDAFAVKCLSNGLHFGYIASDNSMQISLILDDCLDYDVRVISHDEYKVYVEISFSLAERISNFKKIVEGDVAGIYEIFFNNGYQDCCYVGQSKNVNSRLRKHYSNLAAYDHHNDGLQSAWNNYSSSFRHRILEKCPDNLTPLNRQIFLFEKELKYIECSKVTTVNKIDADLVLTKEVFLELKSIVERIKISIKSHRASYVLSKTKIGQEIIDLGIMKEASFSDGYIGGKRLTVKASNVLTWINKIPHSQMEYIPPINREHPQFELLYNALKAEQKKIKGIDWEKKCIEAFVKSFKKRDKFETCDIEDLRQFLQIAKKYVIERLDNKAIDEDEYSIFVKPITPKKTVHRTASRLSKPVVKKQVKRTIDKEDANNKVGEAEIDNTSGLGNLLGHFFLILSFLGLISTALIEGQFFIALLLVGVAIWIYNGKP
jgi:hypothetical protein